jgi:hypothetical protein
MRLFILFLFFSLVSFVSLTQISDTIEAKKFWNDNIQAIVNLDRAKIIFQTNFPLEIRIGDELWSKDDFNANLEKVFTKEVREELKSGSIDNIDAWIMLEDESDTYMVVCYSEFEEYSVLVLMFKQYDGNWKLYGIDMQSDDIEEEVEVEE